ncbi:hypothetical protein F5884DRAFT_754102 [Xylogone sp. PMI_703]|nr:hypothetical protein F5884DRAFT_754102 [Xylogone sp. PMI_703]
MDPITALNLASTILTFIDYATKIVTGTYEVYKSVTGTTEENAHIDAVIGDLREATDDLDSTLVGKTKHEKALKELASRCEALSDELSGLLKKLAVSGGHSTWKSLKAKIKSMHKEKGVAGMEKRLGEYRSEILLRLTLMLSDQQSSIKAQLNRLEDTGLNLSTESTTQLTKLREDILRAVSQLTQRNENLEETGMQEVRDSLKALSSRISAVPKENIILRELLFASIKLREESIELAEEGTFEWIFEEEKEHPRLSERNEKGQPDSSSDEEDTPSARPLPILEGDDESKKVKYANGSPPNSRPSPPRSAKVDSDKARPWEPIYKRNERRKRREEELERRALTRTAFLAWLRAGRSILFETLKSCPELIPAVFPTKWKEVENRILYVEGAFLSASDIQRAFEILTSKGTFPRHRFCFFVDGLDEYHGDMVDHVRLARSLRLWTSGDDVKICASSRLYIEYLETLSDSLDRRIHLHKLTKYDIYLFSRQMIEKELNVKQIIDTHLRLVDRIVEISEGVFLWARLVVRSLLPGILRHDTAQALEKKLEIIPRDLNNLYDQLLDSLEPDDRERAVKMLILTAHNPFETPLNSVVYAWIDSLDDPQFPPTDGIKPSSWPPVNDVIQDVRLQLTSLTKGLLETAPMANALGLESAAFDKMQVVQFFHRTVRDFVLENSKLEDTIRRFPYLIEAEAYHRLWLAEMTLTDLPYRLAQWNSYGLWEVGDARFPQGLPSHLLNGFCRVLDDGQDTVPVDTTWHEFFDGRKDTIGTRKRDGKLSFVHIAAYTGQREYVLQELSKNPELLNGNGELHILLSAALGYRKDLVVDLLQRGSSPADRIICERSDDGLVSARPIWMILTGEPPISYEMLELFLQHEGVDASNLSFLMKDDWDHPTSHFITLRQFLQDVAPPNADRLIALLNRRSGNSYVNAARRFMSLFTPLFKETESAVDKETSGYTRFQAGRDKDPMMLTGIICGDLRIDWKKLGNFDVAKRMLSSSGRMQGQSSAGVQKVEADCAIVEPVESQSN